MTGAQLLRLWQERVGALEAADRSMVDQNTEALRTAFEARGIPVCDATVQAFAFGAQLGSRHQADHDRGERCPDAACLLTAAAQLAYPPVGLGAFDDPDPGGS